MVPSKMIETSAANLLSAERAAKALELRKAGKTYAEIGKACGCSGPYAYKVVRRELNRLLKLRNESAEQLRQMEQERLNQLQDAFWVKALAGDEKAGRMILDIIRERSRLLGLDAPLRVTGTFGFSDLSDEELASRAKTLGLEVAVESLTREPVGLLIDARPKPVGGVDPAA